MIPRHTPNVATPDEAIEKAAVTVLRQKYGAGSCRPQPPHVQRRHDREIEKSVTPGQPRAVRSTRQPTSYNFTHQVINNKHHHHHQQHEHIT